MHRLLGRFHSQEGDNSRIVCAKRSVNGGSGEIESLPAAMPYLKSGHVVLIDLSRTETSLSSSALRTQRRNGVRSWSTGTTAEIHKYIVDNGLYHSI